jgi:hypothetical protein
LKRRVQTRAKLAIHFRHHGFDILVNLKRLGVVKLLNARELKVNLQHNKLAVNESHRLFIFSKPDILGKFLSLLVKLVFRKWIDKALVSHPSSKFFGEATEIIKSITAAITLKQLTHLDKLLLMLLWLKG